MTNLLFFFLIILFGALAGMTVILFITSLSCFCDGKVISGLLALVCCAIAGVGACLILREIRQDGSLHEIEVRQVQIDTTYTITNSKVDTTYVVRYIE